MRLEGLGQLKKSNDLIGTRSRHLPASSIVSQPTTLPRICNVVGFRTFPFSPQDSLQLQDYIIRLYLVRFICYSQHMETEAIEDTSLVCLKVDTILAYA
jgi:hypothetical protein